MTELASRHDRILIVDDEAANVLMLERLLDDAGYRHLRSTTDSTQVEGLYADFDPDLILLDLHMPELDGFGVMQQLSQVIAPDDYVPILVLTADVTQKSKRAALAGGAKDFLTKPFDHPEVLARVGNLLDTRFLHMQLRRCNEVLEDKVRERTTELWQAIGRLEVADKDLRLAQEETIHRLSLAAEFRDDETSRHIERMSRYCANLAAHAGTDERHSELVRIASKMHDIGKIGIPDAILLKPTKLTAEEYEVMKGHAEIGYQILKGSRSELASMGATLAWTHHETAPIEFDRSGPTRTLQLERHLWHIGREVRAAGILPPNTADRMTERRLERLAELSDRQRDIVERLLEGQRVPEIARALFLSPSTVRNHLTQVFRKFHVHSQVDLINSLKDDMRDADASLL